MAIATANTTFAGLSKSDDPTMLSTHADQRLVLTGVNNDDSSEASALESVINTAAAPFDTLKLRGASLTRLSSDKVSIRQRWGVNSLSDDITNAGSHGTINQDNGTNDIQTYVYPALTTETPEQVAQRYWVGFQAAAVMGGTGSTQFVTGVTIYTGGYGYTNPSPYTFSLGSTATNTFTSLTATLTSGIVSNIVVNSSQSGWSSPPPIATGLVLPNIPGPGATVFKYAPNAYDIRARKKTPSLAAITFVRKGTDKPTTSTCRRIVDFVRARRWLVSSTWTAQVYVSDIYQIGTGLWQACLTPGLSDRVKTTFTLIQNVYSSNFIIGYGTNSPTLEAKNFPNESGLTNVNQAFGYPSGYVKYIGGTAHTDLVDESNGGSPRNSLMRYTFEVDPEQYIAIAGWRPFLTVTSDVTSGGGAGWYAASLFPQITTVMPGTFSFSSYFGVTA